MSVSTDTNTRLERLTDASVARAMQSGSLARALRIIAAMQLVIAREAVAGFDAITEGAAREGSPSVAPLLGFAGGGAPLAAAAEKSENLTALFASVLQDTVRQVMAVAMASAPAVVGYTRQTDGKACSRCILLAGKFYRWSEGFPRHPACGCTHSPVLEGQSRKVQNPQDVFDSLSTAEQDRRFGKAGAEAIRMGADMGRVVNARRGIGKAQAFGRDVKVTTVGTGRRKLYTGPGPRLMPESIIAAAEGDRGKALELLRRYGYLI